MSFEVKAKDNQYSEFSYSSKPADEEFEEIVATSNPQTPEPSEFHPTSPAGGNVTPGDLIAVSRQVSNETEFAASQLPPSDLFEPPIAPPHMQPSGQSTAPIIVIEEDTNSPRAAFETTSSQTTSNSLLHNEKFNFKEFFFKCFTCCCLPKVKQK